VKVAVLGTGIMGAPIARNLAAAGHEVAAWNRTAERAQELEGDVARIAGTPAEAVAGAEVVVTMLSDAHAVLSVAGDGGALAAMDDGAIWAQTSTIGLEGTDRAAALAAERGVAFVDAPVLGTRQPAEQGALTVLASGPDETLDRLEPLWEPIAAKVARLGPAGAGTRAKLVANLWVVALVEGLAETIALADGLGVDPAAFLGLIEGGPMSSGYAQTKGRAMIDREFPPAFPLHLAAKDAGLVDEAARAAGVDLPLPRLVEAQMRRASELGHGDEDLAATIMASLRGSAS
jgi:3-hydroxyisobutyrate dehydrogenase